MKEIRAFPSVFTMEPDGGRAQVFEPGMTLRDYFAAKAMPIVNTALVARKIAAEQEDFAAECYALADAMLAAREKK